MTNDMLKRAKLRCMHLLEKRDYTEKELRQKLENGKTEYTEEQIDGAIAYVKSFRYVDDGRYACKYIEAMQSRKSRRQIEQELYQKGVDRELIQRRRNRLPDGWRSGISAQRKQIGRKNRKCMHFSQEKDSGLRISREQ